MEGLSFRRPSAHASTCAGLHQVDGALAPEFMLSTLRGQCLFVRAPTQFGRLLTLADEAVDGPRVHELVGTLRSIGDLRISLRDVNDLHAELMRQPSPFRAATWRYRNTAIRSDVQQRLFDEVRDEARICTMRKHRGRPIWVRLTYAECFLTQCIVGAT